jgi:hypothetical protein
MQKKKRGLKKLIRQLLEIVVLARNVTNTLFIASPSPACEIEKNCIVNTDFRLYSGRGLLL